jgi:hypothetical protein
MPFVRGFLQRVNRRGRPVDPDYGIEEGHPDQGLPGIDGPVDPDYGIGIERPGHLPAYGGRPVDPGYGIPLPPVIDNGLPGGGERPDQGLPPTYPVRPDQGLPRPPHVWPKPPMPPTVWPPPAPVYPSHPIYPGGGGTGGSAGTPDQGLPLPPGAVWPPLPGINGKVLCLVWVIGYGYRWTVIDPSLKPSHPLPGDPGNRPDQGLPGGQPGGPAVSPPIQPTPEPRRG